jgi:hypothetical protein
LQAEQEDSCRSLAQVEVAPRSTKRFGQCAVQDSKHALAGAKAANDLTRARPLPDALQQLGDDGHRNIGADQ